MGVVRIHQNYISFTIANALSGIQVVKESFTILSKEKFVNVSLT